MAENDSNTTEQVETVEVSLDDLDLFGNLHNAKYFMLVERAILRFWMQQVSPAGDGLPNDPDFMQAVVQQSMMYRQPIRRIGPVQVRFRVEEVRNSSAVYAFRIVDIAGTAVYARGRRTVVKVDPRSLKPLPWSDSIRDLATTRFALQPDTGSDKLDA